MTGAEEIENINQKISLIEKILQDLPEMALGLGIRVVIAAVLFFVGTKLISVIRKIIKKSLSKAKIEPGVISFFDGLVKIALYIFLILAIASNFGFDAASVVAILGSAGVAIGLAVQGCLSNVVGGMLLLILKPFKVNDYIKENGSDQEGTVKEIGIIYTILETGDKKRIVLPNGNLANHSITNFSSSSSRRVDLTVGISYSADIKKAKDILIDIANNDDDVIEKDNVKVFVDSLGSSDVVLGLRCFCETSKYWDLKWRLTEAIKLRFDEEGIEIPFQQIDVHLDK